MTKTSQNNYERIYHLIELLKNYPEPLTKQEIFQKLSKFYNHEKEKAKEKLFERDKKLLNELGYQIKQFKFYKLIENKEAMVIGYKISDLFLNNSDFNKFSENDKKKLAHLLLKRLRGTKKKKDYNKIYVLYIKLFFKDPVYLKKILNLKKNHINEELYNLKHHEPFNNIIYKYFPNFFSHKPLQILYKKKKDEVIERIVFPLLVYRKNFIYYLVSWDYEHKAIRNFIIQNILNIKKIHKSDYPTIVINDDITNRIIGSNTIEIPLKEVYFNLPNPLFVKNLEKDLELKNIVMSIKEEYLSLFKECLNLKTPFFKKNLNFKILGKATNEVTISFKLYNIEGLFRFLFLYPEALIRFEDSDILNQYKDYINNIINFYKK